MEVNFDTKDQKEKPLIFYAIEYDKLINFLVLIQKVNINSQSKNGTTVLIKAVKYGQNNFVKILMNFNVEVDK